MTGILPESVAVVCQSNVRARGRFEGEMRRLRVQTI
ncbi:hypothetical protein HNR01_005338 [Methylorubrum rhodesianum]|nr:hypothetical protein [Methylorubrum rhodesianum]